MKQCESCSKPVSEDALFCMYCGLPVRTSALGPQLKHPGGALGNKVQQTLAGALFAGHTGRWIYWVLASAGLGALILAGIVLFVLQREGLQRKQLQEQVQALQEQLQQERLRQEQLQEQLRQERLRQEQRRQNLHRVFERLVDSGVKSPLIGPQAPDPIQPMGEEYAGHETLELELAPREKREVEFPLVRNLDVPCAFGTVTFTWSVRRPYPTPKAAVEFFNERQGAHMSFGASNMGKGSASHCAPIVVVNRSASEVLVEVRYVVSYRRE